MRTKFIWVLAVLALELLGVVLFGQQNPIQIDANGLTQTFGAGGIVTRGQIVKINSSGQVVPVLTTDTSGAIGIAATSQQNVGQVVAVSIQGTPLVQIDASGCTAGNIVSFSTTTGGAGHCASTASGQQVGVAISISSPGSNFWNVALSLGGSGGGSGGGACTGSCLLASTSGVKADSKFVQDATWSNSATPVAVTITASDPPFNSTDSGKTCWGIAGGVTAAPIGTLTFTDATHASCSGTSTGAASSNGTFVWGTDDTAAWQALQTSWYALALCGAIQVPAGYSMLSKGMFNLAFPTACAQSSGNTLAGLEFSGAGFKNTWLIPMPGFNFSTCVANGCFFAGTGGTGITGLTLRDFSLFGANQSLSGVSTSPAQNIFYINAEAKIKDVSMLAWASQASTSLYAVKVVSANNIFQNLWIDNTGSSGGINSTGQDVLCINCFAGDYTGTQNPLTIGGGIFTSVQSGWGSGSSAYVTMNTGVWISYGDFTEGTGASTGRCLELSGGTAWLNNYQCYQNVTPAAGAIGINWPGGSTGIVHICGGAYKGGTTFGVFHSNSGDNTQLFDDCAFASSGTNNYSGKLFGTHSQLPTTSAATNFGIALAAQTIASPAPTGSVTINLNVIQSTLGVGCGAGSNTVTPTVSWTGPGGTAETAALTALSVSANGALDSFQNDTLTISAKAGTAITYTTASILASAGCSTTPQYTAYAKATQ